MVKAVDLTFSAWSATSFLLFVLSELLPQTGGTWIDGWEHLPREIKSVKFWSNVLHEKMAGKEEQWQRSEIPVKLGSWQNHDTRQVSKLKISCAWLAAIIIAVGIHMTTVTALVTTITGVLYLGLACWPSSLAWLTLPRTKGVDIFFLRISCRLQAYKTDSCTINC